jgi:transcriptional regulator with XRE-family HTH domain
MLHTKKGKKAMRYKIKEYREKKRWTQDELAKRAGISRGIVVRLESDEEYETQIGTLNKVAEALGVSLRSLFLT